MRMKFSQLILSIYPILASITDQMIIMWLTCRLELKQYIMIHHKSGAVVLYSGNVFYIVKHPEYLHCYWTEKCLYTQYYCIWSVGFFAVRSAVYLPSYKDLYDTVKQPGIICAKLWEVQIRLAAKLLKSFNQ